MQNELLALAFGKRVEQGLFGDLFENESLIRKGNV
jgi:hypothetical protein